MMKSKGGSVKLDTDEYIDFVGTGGDGANSFNISTTSMFVCAAAGVTVAKHGNRAASSKSGASDLLEALGANIMLEPKQVEQCINETGMGFMNAMKFHKAMKKCRTYQKRNRYQNYIQYAWSAFKSVKCIKTGYRCFLT